MRTFRNERGQTLVISVIFLVVLCGIAAAVLDVGAWYRAHRAAQAAADASALAAAHALPYDPGAATTLASQYSTKNGGGLSSVTFSKKLVTNDTVTVQVRRPTPGIFAKVFGFASVNIGAKASARASNLAEARWVAPIVVNERHPMLRCNPTPCFGSSTTLDYYNLSDHGPDGAGSFGFINLDPSDPNPGTSDLASWITDGYDGYMPLGQYDARTGNPFSASEVLTALNDRIGTEILFPVYRKLIRQGSVAEYTIVGWVGFHLTGVNVQGSNEQLYGWFTKIIWEGIETTRTTDPDFGARVIEMTE